MPIHTRRGCGCGCGGGARPDAKLTEEPDAPKLPSSMPGAVSYGPGKKPRIVRGCGGGRGGGGGGSRSQRGRMGTAGPTGSSSTCGNRLILRRGRAKYACPRGMYGSTGAVGPAAAAAGEGEEGAATGEEAVGGGGSVQLDDDGGGGRGPPPCMAGWRGPKGSSPRDGSAVGCTDRDWVPLNPATSGAEELALPRAAAVDPDPPDAVLRFAAPLSAVDSPLAERARNF